MTARPSQKLLLLPEPHRVPWAELQAFDWIHRLHDCPQDPDHHGEGDVGIHTRMVLEALLTLPAWLALSPEDRQITYLGCLLHDIGKPSTTREDGGRLTSRGHSRAGELLARRLLWELGVPWKLREQVCTLIRYHQMPFYLVERPDAQSVAFEISLRGRCDLLAVVAEADIRGRVARDREKVLDNVELYREFCRAEGCFSTPRTFASDHTRFCFFQSEGRHPDCEVFDDTRTEMVIMSGLPGAGKDTYIRRHLAGWPVVCLDTLRGELEVGPSDNQGQVVQLAKERAKEYLRRGERLVWNATNLTRQRRAPLIQLASDYGARVRMVYVEVPMPVLLHQNRSRAAKVPVSVIRRMTDRWEPPTAVEAEQLVTSVR